MRAQWYELDDFPDYAVSDLGEVSNIKTGMPRKTSMNQFGIVKISLYQGRELITRSVAVLVADAFVPGRTDLFNTPIHLDGDRENCRADNLMWRPRWFAVRFHRQFENEEFHNSNVEIMELTTGRRYSSVKAACMDLGLFYNDVYRSYIHGETVGLTRHEFVLVQE